MNHHENSRSSTATNHMSALANELMTWLAKKKLRTKGQTENVCTECTADWTEKSTVLLQFKPKTDVSSDSCEWCKSKVVMWSITAAWKKNTSKLMYLIYSPKLINNGYTLESNTMYFKRIYAVGHSQIVEYHWSRCTLTKTWLRKHVLMERKVALFA